MMNTVTNNPPIRFHSLNYLRALAVLMIVYDHLGAFRNPTWIVKKIIDFFFAIPLNIIQDFGALGVSLFFLISGFLFSYKADFNQIYFKNAKRISKIYLTNISAFIIFWFFNMLCTRFHSTYWSQFSLKQWIESATLAGYFSGNGDVINGTTWFLIPLFLFYILCMIYAPLYKRYRINSIYLINLLLGVLLYIFYIFHSPLTSYLCFTLIPIYGMIIGELFKKQNSSQKKQTLTALLINWIIMIISFYQFNTTYYKESLYLVSIVYACLLLIVFVLLEKLFEPCKWIDFICRISLSIYVLHMTFGSFLMQLLVDWQFNFTVAFIITFCIIIFISYIHSTFIEKIILEK